MADEVPLNAPLPPKTGKAGTPGAQTPAERRDRTAPEDTDGKPLPRTGRVDADGADRPPRARAPAAARSPKRAPKSGAPAKPKTRARALVEAKARAADPSVPAVYKVPPPAPKSRWRRRHWAVLISFVLLVEAPAAAVAWYLWDRAADQYASRVGFSVRTEENASAIESILGPLDLSGSSSSDTDILYEFIQSQDLVARIDKKLDLRGLWSKADPEQDPVFAYHPPGTIEDLLDHWGRMVKIYYDSGTGLIDLRVLAFTPGDAQAIAEEIYAESTAMINALSAIAREDAIGYARDELDQAVERLKTAREALTQFRNRTQIVDPTIDVQGQAGILNTLNQQLAEALIDLDILRDTTRPNDPRIVQTERKVRVIEARIADEKRKLGIVEGAAGSEVFANLVGEYERLVVDREFAEQTYTAALASYDAAQAEARRQSRYLAAHVRPTLAEKAEYPERLTLLGLITLFLFLSWSVLVLVGYSLRDRR